MLCSAVPFDQQQLLAQHQQQAAAAVAAQQQQLLVQAQLGPQNPPLVHAPQQPPTGIQLTGPLPATPSQGDVDMANAEAVVAPIVIHNPKEPVSAWACAGGV